MPLPLIGLALSLASKFAPSLIGKLTGSDKAEEVAEKVVDIAKVATGQDDPQEAAKAVEANPEIALQFQRDSIDELMRIVSPHIDHPLDVTIVY